MSETTFASGDAELAARVEEHVGRLERLADPYARQTARDALAAVLALHRAGLAKLLERLPKVQLSVLSTEPLVSGLLVLHDLHPADRGARLSQAVEKVRPLLQLNGATVELKVEGDDVAVTLEVAQGCGSSASKVRALLAQALEEAAPDARTIRIDERAP